MTITHPPAHPSVPTPEYEYSADGKTVTFKNAGECLRAAQAGDEPMRTAFEAIAPAHRITIERFKQRPDSYKFEYTIQQYAFFKAAYEAGQAAQVSPRATADVEQLTNERNPRNHAQVVAVHGAARLLLGHRVRLFAGRDFICPRYRGRSRKARHHKARSLSHGT